MNLTARVVGLDRARAKIVALGQVVRQQGRPLLAREGRLVAVRLANSSQPFGSGSAARDAGRHRVAADIYKVYATVGKAYADIENPKMAKAFWRALQHGQIARAQAILNEFGRSLRGVPLQRFDRGNKHAGHRDPRTGRVRLTTPLAVITDPPALKSYISREQDDVGYGKSGWANVARQLGGIRGLRAGADITANWITRQDGRGLVQWSGGDNNPVVTLTSLVRYAAQILSPGEREKAIAIARANLIKDLQTRMRYEAAALARAA